jgi:hypothetical protein
VYLCFDFVNKRRVLYRLQTFSIIVLPKLVWRLLLFRMYVIHVNCNGELRNLSKIGVRTVSDRARLLLSFDATYIFVVLRRRNRRSAERNKTLSCYRLTFY